MIESLIIGIILGACFGASLTVVFFGSWTDEK